MKPEHLRKITLAVLISSLMVPLVAGLGVGPLSLDISVPMGAETTLERYIGVTNPEENPVHITMIPSGITASFVTVNPASFDLPAGPGVHSSDPRPYQNVKVTIKVPRDVEEGVYTGSIIVNQAPVGGGVIGAATQLGVDIKLTVGSLAPPVFPTYVIALMVVLACLTLLFTTLAVRGRLK